jgi:hypothetical protein
MRVLKHAVVPEPATAQSVGRVAALDRLARLDPSDAAWQAELSAVTLGLVDAILCADVEALEATTDPLRDALADISTDTGHAREIRGWLLGMLSFTEWSLQRLPSPDEIELIHDTHARRFLEALCRADQPLGSKDLRQHLSTGDSQISRTGRELMARGLVVQRRIGRTALWEPTPRGRQLLQEPRTPSVSSGTQDEPRKGSASRSPKRHRVRGRDDGAGRSGSRDG